MPGKRDISFATFNLLNLQEIGKPTYDRKNLPFTDANKAQFETKLQWTAAKLHELEADVIGFQEVWSRAALEAVFKTAKLDGDYEIIARDAPALGKPQVALAARKGLVQKTHGWIEGFPKDFRFDGLKESEGAKEEVTVTIGKFSRPILHCAIAIDAGGQDPPPPISVYVAHLKSKAPSRLASSAGNPVLDSHGTIARQTVAHIRRLMEAGAFRALLEPELRSTPEKPYSPIVVLGDLNDATHSVSTELLAGRPGYKLFASSRSGRKSDKGLYTVETLQEYRSQRDIYFTHVFENHPETLDHVLVSEEFYDHSKKRLWSFVEMEVMNDHLNFSDESKSEKERLLAKIGATDHGIVRAEFAWDPVPASVRLALGESGDDVA